ncbi:MAG: translation initiation factor IF-3 [Actinomycetota bacterium]
MQVGRKEKRISQQELRINERIRIPRVRVVGPDGTQIGIIETEKALAMAMEQDLDLVEVAPQADPPVCRIMDYGKYKYEQDVRQRAARKKQSNVVVKEMKMRPKIDTHDYETKKGHVVRFLRQGAKVKVTIMFRGRETVHPELGEKLLVRLADELSDIAKIATPPKLDGRNMTMVLDPLKEAIEQKESAPKPQPRPRREARAPGPPEEKEEEEELEEDEAKPARPVKVTRAEGG